MALAPLRGHTESERGKRPALVAGTSHLGAFETEVYMLAYPACTLVPMEVGVRELRSRLSDYLARVREGQEVVVTERGAAVARIVPIAGGRALDRAIAEGLVTPACKRVRTRPTRRARSRGSVSDLVAEQRR